MVIIKRASEWKIQMAPILTSKVDELKMLGYSKATKDDVWQCLTDKVWKGDPEKRLYEVVEDILHLKASIFMSYLTLQAYQDDNLLASIAALTEQT